MHSKLSHERQLGGFGENTTLPHPTEGGLKCIGALDWSRPPGEIGVAVMPRCCMVSWLTVDGDDSGVRPGNDAHAAQITGSGSKSPKTQALLDLLVVYGLL